MESTIKRKPCKTKTKTSGCYPLSTIVGLLILLPSGLSLSEGGLYEQHKMLINGPTEQFHISST